jgi:hypothetical protein
MQDHLHIKYTKVKIGLVKAERKVWITRHLSIVSLSNFSQ